MGSLNKLTLMASALSAAGNVAHRQTDRISLLHIFLCALGFPRDGNQEYLQQ